MAVRIGSVKQTAGRTFTDDRSSNGKGNRTTVPFIIVAGTALHLLACRCPQPGHSGTRKND